jgi:hypothetical protein
MWLADAKSQFRPQTQWASNVTVSVSEAGLTPTSRAVFHAPMCYPNDEPRPRKSRVAIALWLLTLIGVIAWASGCQVRIEHTWPDKSRTVYVNSRLSQSFDAIELRQGDAVVTIKGAQGDSGKALDVAGKAIDAAKAVAEAAK